jgi:hypothetical protein
MRSSFIGETPKILPREGERNRSVYTYLTSGISCAYRIARSPVAESASRIANFGATYFGAVGQFEVKFNRMEWAQACPIGDGTDAS